jgi:hypothetical protein
MSMGSINHVTLSVTMEHAYMKIVRIQRVLVEVVLSKNRPTRHVPVAHARSIHVKEPRAVVGGKHHAMFMSPYRGR